MDYLFKYEIVLRAFDNFLEANQVPKAAPYTPDVLLVDMVSGYREQLLRMKVKPNFVSLDDHTADVLADYMEEI